MTQRKWTTTDGWEVLTGWDRPLSHFFVNIDRECTGCDGNGGVNDGQAGEEDRDCTTCEGSGTEYLFNNLSDTQYTDFSGGMSMDQVKAVLQLKLTAWPAGLFERLANDKANNVGNDVVHFGTLGKAVETSAQ